MKKYPDIPSSPEQVLAAKRRQLMGKIELMLDWKLSKRIAKVLEPQLDKLTEDEMDYVSAYVGYLDNLGQIEGPLVGEVDEVLTENAASLRTFEEKIGAERIAELNKLLGKE